MLLMLALTAGASMSAGAQEAATLNFQDAEINAVVQAVSEITGKNFVVDPRVKGKVTVLTPTPMDSEGIYQTFLAVLGVLGFAAVPSGDVIKIVPEVKAKQEGGARAATVYEGEDIVTKVIPIEQVPAAELVPILRPLVPQEGHLAAYPTSNMLIISDRASNVRRLESIIRRIDQTGEQEFEIVPLENASAAQVVQTVSQLQQAQGPAAQAQAQAQGGLPIVADERTNSVIIGGDKAQRLRLRALIAHLDTELEQEGGTQVIYLRYADAETLAPILEGFAEQQAQQQAQQGGQTQGAQVGNSDFSILAEPGTNALVVTAPPETMRAVRAVVEQLDIRRAQVLVEAVIAEVSYNKSRELGIDTAVFDEDAVAFASILDPDTLSAATSGAAAAGTTGEFNPLSLVQQGVNIAVGSGGDTTFAALLRALASDSDTNILSAPTLVTMDNEEAEITVGQEVPFLTGSFSTPVSGGGTGGNVVNPFQTIERRDVGLTLTLTPQINEGDVVQLVVGQEQSSISGTAASAVDLVTNKRTINTTVMVDSGDILVLGGLIDENLQESESRVPVLSQIPILGSLFKFRSSTMMKRNLMVFIRPVILRDSETGDYYTRQKYDSVRGIQQENVGQRILLMPGETRPLLPSAEDYKKRTPSTLQETPDEIRSQPKSEPFTEPPPDRRRVYPQQRPTPPQSRPEGAPRTDPGSVSPAHPRQPEPATDRTWPRSGQGGQSRDY